MDDERAALGKRIADAMGRSRLTQRQIADAGGYTYATVGAWRRGDRVPSIIEIPHLAEVLGCQVTDIVGGPAALASYATHELLSELLRREGR